ncbi:MAG: HetP family heterocyst commitment protein [Rivularia sp. (in: cyanobacteria)]
MNQYISGCDSRSNDILNAILASKYSWACFLILDYAGYDPKNYLPYRTNY